MKFFAEPLAGRRGIYPAAFLGALLTLCGSTAGAQSISIAVDANANKLPINPLIYGVAFGATSDLTDLNAPINRSGGDSETCYNWELNATNLGSDWYFESQPGSGSTPGEDADSFIQSTQAAGAQPMLTVPMLGWVANLGSGGTALDSFSVAKYGAQTATDPYWPDAGNGILASTGAYVDNDPSDASVTADVAYQQGWVNHLVDTWGTAAKGGLGYYLMDNESSIWFTTHRDVHPIGAKMDEILGDIENYAGMVKSIDPSALVVGPEEWGWTGYFYSGYDQWYASINGWGGTLPDRAAHNNMDYIPYLLQQLNAYQQANGTRLLDVLSVHWYPEGGEFSDDNSTTTDLLRNQSTRSLWDPNYVDQSWVNAEVYLIPRMQNWVSTYYPGTQTAITEYNWGAEDYMNGATTQADIYGIFGRQGLDMATRWEVPPSGTPTYNAMKMYRNYDGNDSTFGDTSVSDTVPDPDDVSSFAALRSSDNALTIMVINKQLTTDQQISLSVANFNGSGTAQTWQLASSNPIERIADTPVTANVLTATLPAQSITLFILPPSGSTVPPPAAPAGLIAGAASGEVVLDWDENSAATSYDVLRATSSTGTFVSIGTVAVSTDTDRTVTNGTTYYYEVTAVNSAGTSGPSNVVSAEPTAANVDNSPYNFETSTQGWVSSGGMITGVETSIAEAYLGAYSLEVDFSGAGADVQTVSVASPATAAGSTVVFHVWIPSGSTLSGIQPYVQQGASGNWLWTGTWTDISELQTNAWNTITVDVPTNAVVPLAQLGVQFVTSGAWTGTCYVDSINWSTTPVTHVLWTSSGGAASLWAYNPASGEFTQNSYGPYGGWTPEAIGDGPDGLTRVLWTTTSGAASIWSVNNSTGAFTQNTFGPYPGWTATAVSVGADNTTHVLWSNASGATSLWNYNTGTGAFAQNGYGPYPGWSARAVADGPDGMTRMLWENASGTASIWDLDNTTGAFTQNSFGPYPGWTSAAISVGADSTTHVLWTNTGGAASVWNYSTATGAFTQSGFGPFPGWSSTSIADSSDGNVQLLWTSTSGAASVWDLDNVSGAFTQNSFGPFAGWAATAVSAYP
ncbi:MAG: glycoside hydrolase family 44 protein [Capsulimonadaceae bacterium]